MSEQSLKILNYLKEHNGEAPAQEIAEAIEMEKRRVDSCFSASFIRAGLGERDTSVSPSVLRLTEEGKNFEDDGQNE